MAAATWLLAWPLLPSLCLAAGAGFNPNESIDTHLHPESGRNSEASIIGLLLLSALIFVSLFFYQRMNKNRDKMAEEDLNRLKTTDKCLKQILQNFSIQQLEENKFRGITPKIHTASLEFREICCSVMTGQEERFILEDITGKFEAYHLSAIMGPSGCGKSTLLDVLTGKKKNDGKWTVTGDILINDQKIDIQSIKPVTGFVPQDDVVHEGLTVRENIYFSAAKRMPRGTSSSRLRAITNDVLQVLQLESRQNLLVGNRVRTGEGLSGGQKKRVNVGLELAACPTILFLDEPTSGLDATASLMIVQQLKRIARLGVTIVMVVHQPRYDLFTLLDDVLLLGTLENRGGRLAYMGPTVQAKSHFGNLGLRMPENWNPADWMMDILSGQNLDQNNCQMPVSQIPSILFEKWQNRPEPLGQAQPRHRGRSSSNETEEIQIIKEHCKDCWTEVAPAHSCLEAEEFAKVLKACLGGIPDEDIVQDIMERASKYDVRGNSMAAGSRGVFAHAEADADSTVTLSLRAFCSYLLSFRGVAVKDFRMSTGLLSTSEESDSDMATETSDDGEDGEDVEGGPDGATRILSGRSLAVSQLKRAQPGFCTHLRYTLRTSLITFWRTMGIKILFLLVICFAAAFLSLMGFKVFQEQTWSPTSFLNAQIAQALLISVYSLQLFSVDQAMYWREASHGLNRAAFFVGRALVNTLDWLLLTFFFLLVYYAIAAPALNFLFYIWPFVLVSYVASGWGYAISCCLPVEMGAFISSILAFMMGGILGLPQQMVVFLDGGFFEIVVGCISFTRWSVSMSFLEYIYIYPPDASKLSVIDQHQLPLFRNAYQQARFILPGEEGQWWTGMLALLLQGSVLRVVAYLGLRFTNRARQV